MRRFTCVLLGLLCTGCAAPEPGHALLLGVSGYAAASRVGSGDGTTTGLSGSIGGEITPHVDFWFRGTGASTETDGRARDADTTYLDFALRGHRLFEDDIRPYTGRVDPYFEAFLGYGFLDPETGDDAAEGVSWGAGAGVEWYASAWVRLEIGLEYRHSSFDVDYGDDFDEHDLALRCRVVTRLTGLTGTFQPPRWAP